MQPHEIQASLSEIFGQLRELNNKAADNAALMRTLVGNGQPGRIGKIEAKVEMLNDYRNKAIGYIAAISGLIAFLGVVAQAAIAYYKH